MFENTVSCQEKGGAKLSQRIIDTVVNVITSQYVTQCMQRESKEPKKIKQLQLVMRIKESEIVFFCKLHGE